MSIKAASSRVFWISLGWLSFVAAVIGVFVPIWPTTVFVLIASFSFARGSPTLHEWLRAHPRFGPPLRRWEDTGCIPLRAKALATGMILVSVIILMLSPCPGWAKALTLITLAGVVAYILSRPSV